MSDKDKGQGGRFSYIVDPLQHLAVPIDTLHPDASNARKHNEKNMDAIKESLHRFGQRIPIVVQKSNMVVRAGNGRLAAAKALGWSHIAAVIVDDSSVDAVSFAIADNRTAELAEWNKETLASLLDTMDENDLKATGFDDADLKELLAELTPEMTEDEVPEAPAKPVTQSGDLWELGEHRVLCGDSTKEDDVSRVMNGAKADLIFTSPPYALGESIKLSNNVIASKRGSAYDVHEDEKTEWSSLMARWFPVVMNHASGVVVVNLQLLAGNKVSLFEWVANWRDHLVDVAIWDKKHAAPQMAAGVLNSRFEFLFILSTKKNPSRSISLSSFIGTVANVYEGPPQRQNEFSSVHAATMPIHLPIWIMSSLCGLSKSVLDPFMGTGTTLIAAQQLGRRCFGLELSPQYCDVIVKRWEKATGKRAYCNGKSIDELAKERGVV